MGQTVQDRNGRVTGYLLTPEEYSALMRDHALATPMKRTYEEALAAAGTGTGKTTEEILAMVRGWDQNPPEPRS